MGWIVFMGSSEWNVCRFFQRGVCYGRWRFDRCGEVVAVLRGVVLRGDGSVAHDDSRHVACLGCRREGVGLALVVLQVGFRSWGVKAVMDGFFGFLESGLVVLMAVTLLVAVAYCAMKWSRRFAWGFSDVLHGRMDVGDAFGRMRSSSRTVT